MKSSIKRKVIMIGCFGGNGKRGGTRTFVESLSSFLKGRGYEIINIPQSQEACSGYSCLAKIKIDSIKKKFPKSSVAIAQTADHLFVFKLFNKKIRTICMIHSDNQRQVKLKKNKLIANVYRKIEKRGLRMADRIVCVDRWTYDVYRKRYPWIEQKSSIIPVGVNTSNFKPMDRKKCRHDLYIPNNARVMLVVARLEKEKNVGAIIEMVRYHLDLENHYLLIVGMGREGQKLKDMACKIKNVKVRFLGQVPYPELPKIINAADVVLVPSLFESGPLIIIEAMACGVPSVSTDVGRASIFIGDSNCGAVIDDVDSIFAEKVKEFLSPQTAVRGKCLERVKSFSFHNTGEETLGIIRGLE